MPLKFKEPTRHGRSVMLPGVIYGFEDPDAEDYFVKAFGATKTSQKAVHTFSQDDVSIDPETTFADGPMKGQRVIEGKTNG